MPAQPPSPHAAWDGAVQSAAGATGVVLVIGAPDTGKSTFILSVANEALRRGRRVSIVDGDLENGEAGPPGCLVLLRPEAPVGGMPEIRTRAAAFVGDSSPQGHASVLLPGMTRLIRESREKGDELILVDTAGFVRGRIAERLQLATVQVLQPELLVLLHREEELDRLTDLIESVCSVSLLPVRTPADAPPRSLVYRKIRRANRIRRHFQGAQLHDLDAGQVAIFDAWLYSGRPLVARDLQLAAHELGCEVARGEVTDDGVYFLTAQNPRREGLVALQERFRKRRLIACPVIMLQNLLVGMVARGGRLVDVGLLQGINFDRALFSVLSPARSVEDVRMLHFGRIRVRPDGTEVSRLRPGDL